jgi:hypothetical protein
MLGGHSRCLTTHAAQFVTDTLPVVSRITNPSELQDELRRQVGSHHQFRHWKVALPERVPVGSASGTVATWYGELVRRFGEEHGRPDFDCWVSHSPANIRHVASLRRLFPEARFIHIVRDGRGVAASARGVFPGIRTIKQAALLWAERLAHGLAAERHSPDVVHRIHYEDLVREPAATMREIAGFLELTYEEGMLRGDGFQPGGNNLVGEPPDPSRASAWRSSLSRRDIELFEFYSGELLEYLGYEMTTSPLPPTARERVSQELSATLGRIGGAVQQARIRSARGGTRRVIGP